MKRARSTVDATPSPMRRAAVADGSPGRVLHSAVASRVLKVGGPCGPGDGVWGGRLVRRLSFFVFFVLRPVVTAGSTVTTYLVARCFKRQGLLHFCRRDRALLILSFHSFKGCRVGGLTCSYLRFGHDA